MLESFFITVKIIVRDKAIHIPDLKEPRLITLFDDFPGLLIDTQKASTGSLSQGNIINLIVFRSNFISNILRTFEYINTHPVKVLRSKETFRIIKVICVPAVVTPVLFHFFNRQIKLPGQSFHNLHGMIHTMPNTKLPQKVRADLHYNFTGNGFITCSGGNNRSKEDMKIFGI